MRNTTLIFILVLIPTFTACVSVSLGGSSSTKRASGVEVREPDKPFTKQSLAEVDAAWTNENNGNAISYVSDCKDATDPSLEYIMTGLLGGIVGVKRESDQVVTIQGREGKRVLASGKVDGVPTKLDLLVFKRNQCIYILSYVGVQTAFDQNREAFNRFIEGFRAP